MRRLYAIIALFLALWWVPSTGHSALSDAYPQIFGLRCECDEPGEAHGKLPCKDDTCNQCVTLESGVDLTALGAVIAPVPVWSETDLLVYAIRQFAENQAAEVVEAPKRAEADSPPPLSRTILLSKAQPARGPSIEA